MEIKTNNINFVYGENYSIRKASITLVGSQGEDSFSSYITLETTADFIIDDLSPKELGEVAKQKLLKLLTPTATK